MSGKPKLWRQKKREKSEEDKFLFGDSQGPSTKSQRMTHASDFSKSQARRILPSPRKSLSLTGPAFPQNRWGPSAKSLPVTHVSDFAKHQAHRVLPSPTLRHFKNVKPRPQNTGTVFLPQPQHAGCSHKRKSEVGELEHPQNSGGAIHKAVEECSSAHPGQTQRNTFSIATPTATLKLLTLGTEDLISSTLPVFPTPVPHVADSTHASGVYCHHEFQQFPVQPEKSVQLSDKLAFSVQCDEFEEEDRDSDSERQPKLDDSLYVGSRISVQDSLYSILSFVQSENLTISSLSRLLALIELHCPDNSNCFTSCYEVLKLVESCESKIVLSFYCSVCFKSRASKNDTCNTCNDPGKKVEYFVHFPLYPQICKLYKRPGFLTKIKHKYNRVKKNGDHYEDIYDGEVYKEAEASFLSNSNNISLTWHGDGVQKYESSPYSLCNFYYTINELPPEERFKPENILIGVIWGSKEKPHPNVLLKHTADDLLKLRNGVEVLDSEGEKEEVKVILLCGTCDSPAKASFFNSKTHAGYYSCPCCFTKGEKSPRTGQVMAFPYEEQLTLRTVESYRPLVEASLRIFKSPEEQDKVCKGIKGPTLLSHVLFSSMFDSTAIDSMHCLYLGITKQILVLLFNEDYKLEPFSLFEHVDLVDKRLLGLKLPEFVQRLPLSVLKLVYWKGTLCRNFFFYILLPLLKDLMEEKYFSHLTLLVDSMALLNGRSISENEIIVADLKISEFLKRFQDLYGLRHMSFNLHLCRHAARCVRMLGPMWVTSCFPYEDLNGKMANLAHGTKDAPIQIAKRMSLITEMPLCIDNLPSGVAKSFCQRMSQKWRRLHINEVLRCNVYTIGFYDKVTVCEPEIRELLNVLSPDVNHFVTFPKLFYNRQLYVASSYTRTSRDSSYVKYEELNCDLYGEILTFVKADSTNQIFAYIHRLEVQPFCTNILRYVHKCVGGGESYDLVPLKRLLSLCIKISVGDKLYICDTLNDFELD